MNQLGANKLHPLQIEDARGACHRASELQREVEDTIRNASKDLAEKERAYRKALSQRIVTLKAEGCAVTAAKDIARGEDNIADLRYERDVAQGIYEAALQQAFRRGADRKDTHELLVWSERRDLRTDTPPEAGQWGDAYGRQAA